MTELERFREMMRFGHPDRVPNWELGVWGQVKDRWAAEGAPSEAYEGDWWGGWDDFWPFDRRIYAPVSMDIMPPFEAEVIEETDRYLVARHAYGHITKALKENTAHGTRWCMDQYLSFAVRDRETWLDMKRRYNPETPGRYPDNWDELAAEYNQREVPLTFNWGQIGLYWCMREWMGTEALSLAFYDQPNLVHEMLEHLTDFIIRVTTRALRDVDEFEFFNFAEDVAFKNGPLISPQIFDEFFAPRYRRVCEHLRSGGVRHIMVDSDGNFEVLLGRMLDCGIDTIWPCEQAADMNLARIRRNFPELRVWGGVDKRELAKDRAAIDAELEKLRPILDQGGCLPTVDHTVPPDVSYDNFCYYMERKQELLELERGIQSPS